MADRWYLVPIAGTGPLADPYRPKYTSESGISGWSGQQVTVSGTDYYAVRFVGTTSALDTIETYSDATSLQESGLSKSDIASYLNKKTGNSYSFSEWEQRFLTGSI